MRRLQRQPRARHRLDAVLVAQDQRKTVITLRQGQVQRHLAVCRSFGERRVGQHVEVIRADLGNGAYFHAQVLRRIEGADVVLAALGEIVGMAAVEVLVDVGREEDLRAPAGGAHEACAALDDLVQQQAVVGRDVLHVAHVLVAAL